MPNAAFTLFTTTAGKGWISSALFHVLVIGTLALISSGRIEPQIVRFASAKSTPVTLSLTQVESAADNVETAVTVEVQPWEAMIDNKRFVQASTVVDPEMDQPEVAVDVSVSAANPVRQTRGDDRPQPADFQTEVPKRTQHLVSPQLSSRVESLPVAETTLPEFGDNRPPHYPRSAISRGWEGTVLLRVHLSAEGTVTDVEVIDSSGYTVLDGAAVNAVKTWTAKPATRRGQPSATTIRLPVKFRLPKS